MNVCMYVCMYVCMHDTQLDKHQQSASINRSREILFVIEHLQCMYVFMYGWMDGWMD